MSRLLRLPFALLLLLSSCSPSPERAADKETWVNKTVICKDQSLKLREGTDPDEQEVATLTDQSYVVEAERGRYPLADAVTV